MLQRLIVVLAIASIISAGIPLQAATLVWDANTGTVGVQDGSGTWSVAGTTWWNPLTSANAAEVAADTVIFGGSGNSVGGTITLSGNQAAAGLIFGRTITTGYSLTAGSATSVTIGAGGISILPSAQPVTIGDANLSLLLSATQRWNNFSSNAATIGGALNLSTFNLTQGLGNFTMNGAITGSGGLEIGFGTTTINALSGYTGATTIGNGGTLILSGANGALTGTTSILLNRGTLTLDNTTAANADRLLGTAITINGASTLNFNISTGSGSYSETLGALTLQSGAFNFVTQQATTGQTSVVTSSISRTGSPNYSAINFVGTGLGATGDARNRIVLTGAAAGDLGPWAIYNNNDFAQYSTTIDTAFERGVIASTSTALAAGSNNASTNFKQTTAITITAGTNPEYKTLAIVSGTNRALTVGTNDLYIVSGGLMASLGNHNIAAGGTVTTGAKSSGTSVPLFVQVGDNIAAGITARTFTINSVIRNNPGGGTLDLVKSGPGTLTLTAANTYGGVTVINEGVLRSNTTITTFNGGETSGWLGTSSNAATNLVFNGGTLFYDGATAGTTDRLFTLGPGGGGITNDAATNGTLTFSNVGSVVASGTGDRTLTLTANGTGTFTFSPIVVNPTSPSLTSLAVAIASTGIMRLEGANTFSGDSSLTAAAGGELRIASIGGLGTATWAIGSGSIVNFMLPTAATPATFTGSLFFGDNNASIRASNPASGASSTATIGAITLGTAVLTVARGINMSNNNQTHSITTGAFSLTGDPTINLTLGSGTSSPLFSVGALNDQGFARTINLVGGAGTGSQLLRFTAATTGFTAGTNILINGGLQLGVRIDNATGFGTSAAPGLITFQTPATVGGVQLRTNAATNFRTNFALGDNSVDFAIGGASGSTQLSKSHTAGTLSIGSATLTLTGAFNTAVDNVYSLTLGATTFTGNPVLAVNNVSGTAVGRLTLGALSDGGTARLVTKSGQATLTLSTATSALTSGGTLTATLGNVEIGNANALANYGIVLGDGTTSGKLVVLAGTNVSASTPVTYFGGFTTLADGAISGPTSGTGTISSTININDQVLAGAGHFVGGGGTLNITGPIVTGGTSNGIAVIRGGNVQLSQAVGNTYTQLSINAGAVTLGVANGIQTSANVVLGEYGSTSLTFNGFNQATTGTWTLGGFGANSAAVTTIDTGANTLFLSGTLANNVGSTATQIVNGVVDLGGGTRTFDIDSGATTSDLTVNASVSNGNVLKTGVGILTLAGTNSLGAGSNVNVLNGTLLAGFGTGGTETITVGGNGSLQFANSLAQTLTLSATTGALILNAGARLGFELNASGTNDQITIPVGGTATTSIGSIILDFYNLGSLGAGTYNLISAPSGLNAATYQVGNAPLGFNYTISQSDTLVQLTTATIISRYWTGDQGSSWNTNNAGNTNWSTDAAGTTDATATPIAAQTVIFSATNAAGPVINTTLDNAFTIEGMQFLSAPTGVTAVNLNNSGGSSLTLAPPTSSAGIFVGDNAGTITLGAGLPVTAQNGQTWNVVGTGANGSALVVAADVNYVAGVSKSGAGVLTLSGTNTGAGSLTLTGGTLRINSTTAPGTGTLTVGAGTTIDNTTGGAITLVNNNAVVWNGSFTFTGTQNLNLGGGALTLGNDVTATTLAGILTVGGNIGDGVPDYVLTKAGAGTLTLSGANTFGGGVVMNNGTLNINSSSALGTGNFTIAGGVIDNTSGGAVTLTTNNAQSWNTNIVFTGTNSLNLGSGAVTLGSAAGATRTVTVNASTLTVGGVGNGIVGNALTKAGNGILEIGGNSDFTGALTISAGVFRTTGTLNNGTSVTNVSPALGNASLLIVPTGGSHSSNTFTVGTTQGVGAIIVNGGSLTATTALTTAGISMGTGIGGYGGIFLTSGSVTANRFDNNSAAADTVSIIRVTGGTLTSSEFMRFQNSRFELTVTGGQLMHAGATQNIALGSANSSIGALTVAGGTLDNTGRNITVRETGGTPTVAVNINAGTLITNSITVTTTGAGISGIVNLNGGTLSPGSNAGTLLTTNLTAAYVNGAFGSFTGGAVINTAGFNTTIAQPLLAPNGDGVGSLTLATPGSGYIGAPYVEISGGGGSGATGYAVVDQNPASVTFGQITGLVITNPGVGYTSAPTVAFVGGGGTGAAAMATTTPNTSGGLTKNGAGVLTISGANTYTGATVINGGSVLLGANDIFENTNAITINNGATLDIDTRTDTVGAVTLTDGNINGSSGILTSSSYAVQNGSIGAILAGVGGLTKSTGGSVLLSGANTFTGPVMINSGILSFATNSNLGDNTAVTNTLTLGGGTLRYTGTTSLNLGVNRAVTVNAGTGTVDVTSATGSLTVSGGVVNTSTGNLTKTGLGELIISGSVNLNGGTVTIANGKLQAGFGPAGISSLSVDAVGNMSLQNSAAEALNGLTLLSLINGARLGFELGTLGNNDQLNLGPSGILTVGATVGVDLFNLGGLAAGTYSLINSPLGGLSASNFSLLSGPSGFSFSFGNSGDGKQLFVNVSAFVPRYWTGSQATTSWSTVNAGPLTNWSTDAAGLTNATDVPGASHTVIFSATNAAGPTITTTLDAAFTIDSLQFLGAPTGVTAVNINNSTGSSLVLAPVGTTGGISVDDNAGIVTLGAGLPLTVASPQTWAVVGTGTNGSALIVAADVAFNASVNKTLAGALTLSGANTGSGPLTLTTGTINLDSAAALGTGAFTIGNNTTINNTGGGGVTLSANSPLNFNGVFTFTGSNNLAFGTGAVTLGTNVTVTAAAAALTIGGAIDDGASTFSFTKLGNGTLVLNGANAYDGLTTLSAGVLTLAGDNSGAAGGVTTTAGATLNINHAGALGVGTFTVNGGILDNTSGIAVTNANNNAQVWNAGFAFTGSNNLNLGTGNVTLGAALTLTTVAKALTVGGVIDDGVNTFALTKNGPGTLMVSGVGTYGGATNIDDGTYVVGVADALPTNTTIRLGTGATAATLDLNGFNQSIAGFSVQTNSTLLTNLLTIAPGTKLTVNGAVTIGVNLNGSNTLFAANGGGAWEVLSSGANFQVGSATTANFENSVTADLTALATFAANLGTGIFRVGDNGNGTPLNTSFSVLRLAPTSTITAASFRVGDGPSTGSSSSFEVTLGSATNTINADSINIGMSGSNIRAGGKLVFGALDVTGTVKIRASDGAGRVVLNMINSSGNAPESQASVVDFTGHTADLLFSTVTMASRSQSTGIPTATLSFDQGTFDATNVTMAVRTGLGTGNATATLNLGDSAAPGTPTVTISTLAMAVNTSAGGTVQANLNITGGNVGIGSINMANAGSGRTATSVITLTGGATTLGGNIVRADGLGVENATITLNGTAAILNLNNNNIGTLAAPLTFSAQAGTLRNLAQLNGGDASAAATLNKTTSGTLLLDTPNSYTGFTTVTAGVLQITHAGALGGVTRGTTVAATGAALEISNSITTSAEALTLNGTGVGNGGALRSTSGTNTYAGNITLTSAARINADSTSILTLDVASGNAVASTDVDITFGAAGDIIVADSVALGNGGVTKNLGGKLTFTAANSYTGPTLISAGTLQLGNGGATGSLPTTSGITNNGTLTINRSNFVVQGTDFSGAAIGGSGSFVQAGAGRTRLTAANNYAGTTSVDSGVLTVNGTVAGSGVAVVAGAALNGGAPSATPGATISATSGIVVNGGVSPGTGGQLSAGSNDAGNNGNGVGRLDVTAGGISLGNNSVLVFDFNQAIGVEGTNWDYLNVAGTVTLGTNLTLYIDSWDLSNTGYGKNEGVIAPGPNDFNPDQPFASAYHWKWMTTGGILNQNVANGPGYDYLSNFTVVDNRIGTGVFSSTAYGAPVGGQFWVSATGNDLYINYSAVPEPGSLLLVGIAGLGLAGYRRRKRRQECKINAETVRSRLADPSSKNPAAVAISHGDDLTKWDLVVIPAV